MREQTPAGAMDNSSPLSSAPSLREGSSSPDSSLSTFSRTPSLPDSPSPLASHASLDLARRYPSPMSTIASGTQSPLKLSDPVEEPSNDHGPPPAKRRRVAPPPKERKTEHLDLLKFDQDLTTQDTDLIKRLTTVLQKKKKIVVIAGAGISVSAGIPDFRSSTGLFATSGKHLFDASVYKHDSSTQSFHTMVREMDQMTKNAQPTPFHHFLASLAQQKRLLRLYSQNIDCLDTKMEPLKTNVPLNHKGPWPATIQLHGGLEKQVCTKCRNLEEFDGQIFDGPEAPCCKLCKAEEQARIEFAGKRGHGIGRLRPRFVLYNEFNPDADAIGNVSSADLKARPDAVLVVGTSLKVPGTRRLVKELCQVTRGRRDGFTAWINIDAEPKGVDLKDCWDMVIRAKCDDVARMAALPPWDCNIGNDYLVSKVDIGSRVEVHIGAKSKQVEDVQGIPTPQPSPKMGARHVDKTKTKQTKLPFGNNADTTKAKRGRGRPRKPKQPAQKEDTKSNLLGTFKRRKNASSAAGKKAASKVLHEPSSPSDLSLPPLRPDPPARRLSDGIQYCAEAKDSPLLDSKGIVSPAPTSPTHELFAATTTNEPVLKDMRPFIELGQG